MQNNKWLNRRLAHSIFIEHYEQYIEKNKITNYDTRGFRAKVYAAAHSLNLGIIGQHATEKEFYNSVFSKLFSTMDSKLSLAIESQSISNRVDLNNASGATAAPLLFSKEESAAAKFSVPIAAPACDNNPKVKRLCKRSDSV